VVRTAGVVGFGGIVVSMARGCLRFAF